MCGKTEILVTYIHGAAFISEQLQYKILYCECSDMNAAPCLYVLVKYFVKTFHKCNSVMSSQCGKVVKNATTNFMDK